ncbi:hypothetical protein Rsub_02229 [Raphidocelis subcapitata]|uniref:Mitochondrial Rho GTPase n=1 Tax=Raphidocelis subcapitata TaxID=307507 RepID=A0A2V0NP08_9CHLO|nr:hypothetical protein Rsub_02229 [Raphidocelis subcapitata]|eukprot:GBF89351.1 hypothetical protein Rsub_02229 [Raphidocelis subcapitata]
MAPGRGVAITVVGDPGVGKTSLITAACQEQFSESPVPTLPTARFPPELLNSPEELAGGELLVVDTSSRAEDARATEAAIRAAAAVVVCIDATRQRTLERLRSHWLPEVARLNPGAPVVVAVCKDDRGDRVDLSVLREAMEVLISTYSTLEVSIRCSAREMRSVGEVFYHAIRAVLYPKAPLLEAFTGRLTTACVKALLRIFLLCDSDQDGALNDDELNAFQYLCFGQLLSEEELASVKAMVAERMPEGLGEAGLMFPGFMYLHTLFLTRGRLESTWTVLKTFGYNHELRIAEAVLAKLPPTGPDTVLELSPTALAYLAHTFDVYDSTRAGVLSASDMEHMFNRAPVPIYQLDLWSCLLVAGAVAGAGAGGLSKEGFLTRWRAFALQDPAVALEQMMYLGLGGRCGEGAGELFEQKPRRRRGDRRGDLSARTILSGLVFGAPGSGKSSLIRALAVKPGRDAAGGLLSAAGNVAVGGGGGGGGGQGGGGGGGGGGQGGGWEGHEVKTLVLTEVAGTAAPDDPLTDLSRADVALVVYDSSDAASFAAARALAVGVSTAAGEGLPVVLVAAKDDLGSSPELQQRVAEACADLVLAPPLAVSVVLGALGSTNVFRYAAEAALRPEGFIPDTPARKLRRRNVRRAWIAAGVAVSSAAAGYAAFRVYKAGSGGAAAAGGGGGGGGAAGGRR